jgi:hypothetical protein
MTGPLKLEESATHPMGNRSSSGPRTLSFYESAFTIGEAVVGTTPLQELKE